MKYKYSRKQLAKMLKLTLTPEWIRLVLLKTVATKQPKPTGNQDKEECKHDWRLTTDEKEFICIKCAEFGEKIKPEELKEIEPPKNIKYLNSDLKRWVKEVTIKINHLSRREKWGEE